jgi:hypothetical protein
MLTAIALSSARCSAAALHTNHLRTQAHARTHALLISLRSRLADGGVVLELGVLGLPLDVGLRALYAITHEDNSNTPHARKHSHASIVQTNMHTRTSSCRSAASSCLCRNFCFSASSCATQGCRRITLTHAHTRAHRLPRHRV